MNLRGRLLIAAVTAAIALAVPQAASAFDLYVDETAGNTTCAQDDPCSLTRAIFLADLVSTRDTIHAGQLFQVGSVDLSNSPIDLIGSGADDSAINGSLHIGSDSSA